MAVTRVVTVVLPFVPVMATTFGPPARAAIWAASSISARTGTPAACAAAYTGWLTGTPGLGTTSSQPANLEARRAAGGVCSRHDADLVGGRHRLGRAGVVEHDRRGAAMRQGARHRPARDPEPDDGGPGPVHPVAAFDRKSA